jgi:hypothetical protein
MPDTANSAVTLLQPVRNWGEKNLRRDQKGGLPDQALLQISEAPKSSDVVVAEIALTAKLSYRICRGPVLHLVRILEYHSPIRRFLHSTSSASESGFNDALNRSHGPLSLPSAQDVDRRKPYSLCQKLSGSGLTLEIDLQEACCHQAMPGFVSAQSTQKRLASASTLSSNGHLYNDIRGGIPFTALSAQKVADL